MKDPKNLSIALLCVSATVLATALALPPRAAPAPAHADVLATAFALLPGTAAPAHADTPVRGGDYIMITGAYSDSVDLLYVIDVVAQKVNTYVFNPQTNELVLRDQFDLKPVFTGT